MLCLSLAVRDKRSNLGRSQWHLNGFTLWQWTVGIAKRYQADCLLLLGCDDKDGGREASYPIEVNVYDVCSSWASPVLHFLGSRQLYCGDALTECMPLASFAGWYSDVVISVEYVFPYWLCCLGIHVLSNQRVLYSSSDGIEYRWWLHWRDYR